MASRTPETFDFRFLTVIPVLIGLGMMAFPTLASSLFFELVIGRYGVLGFVGYAGIAICILRFNRLTTYFLAQSFFQTWKRNGKFVVVEIEPASTYTKFKLLPDDVGIVYAEDQRVFLETLGEIHDITDPIRKVEWIAVQAGTKPRVASISIGGSPSNLVLKPIYNKFSFRMQKDIRMASEWMLDEIHSWNPSTPPRQRAS